MYKFKIGDEIILTAGKDKGKKGKIEKIYKKENKVLIPGVNIYKRHKKTSRNQSSGVFDITRPLPVTNIALICPKCSKQARVGFKKEGAIKYRICKKCQGRLA